MIRVAHIITGLGVGGAEAMLVKLAGAADPERFHSTVISLSSDVALAGELRSKGIEVISLAVPPSMRGALRVVPKLVRLLSARRIDLVQTWMYHADMIGGIAARLSGRRVLWNIQTSASDLDGLGRRTVRIARACGRLSKMIPRAIVSCSAVGVATHRALGYDTSRFRVIPNGTDLEVFRPDAADRASFRAEIGAGPNTCLIGMVARLHPMKDHEGLLQAFRRVAALRAEVRLILIGRDLDPSNQSLTARIAELGLTDRVVLLGVRTDIPRILCGLDVHALSSAHSEGFPNVLGEAMATGVRCVTTDVGDSGLIVGNTGGVVPPRQPEQFAESLLSLLDAPPSEAAAMSARARERVQNLFSLKTSVAAYEALYEEVTASR